MQKLGIRIGCSYELNEIYFNHSRRRTEQFLQWRKHEEARRFAVDSAIKELFARDFQYRKELKSHIENRLQNAEKRRRSLRQRSIEVKTSRYLSKYFHNNSQYVNTQLGKTLLTA